MVNGHVTEVASLMEEELPYYSLMEGEWLCCRGGHFNVGRMVMLQRWSVSWRENGHVTEVVSLME